MGQRRIRGVPGGRWLLAALGVVGMLLSCSVPEPVIPAPVRIESASWHVGAEVELTVQIMPAKAGESVSVAIFAPGTNQPSISGLEAEYFGLSGVQLFWLAPEYRETEIALAAAAGARYIGLDFEWRKLEPAPDQFVWTDLEEVMALAKRHGVQLVPMLLYTPRWASTAPYAPLDTHRAPPADVNDYRDFVYAVVSRYKPHGASPLTKDGYGITDWVVWNEPNLRSQGGFWTGSPEEYLQLLRAGYEGAHAADPDCNVLNGALADLFWDDGESDLITALERLYDPNGDGDASDGGRPFFDTLNIHTYQTGTPKADWYTGRLQAVMQVMDRFGDSQKPVWITETGYGSITGPVADSPYVDEETQAEAALLIYETCSAYPRVERVFWWSLRDYYSDASATNLAMEAHYGLLRANFAPKLAYLAYGRLTGNFDRVLTLGSETDVKGTAGLTVPASFVSRPGRYVVFAGTGVSIVEGQGKTGLVAVASYTALSAEQKEQD